MAFARESLKGRSPFKIINSPSLIKGRGIKGEGYLIKNL